METTEIMQLLDEIGFEPVSPEQMATVMRAVRIAYSKGQRDGIEFDTPCLDQCWMEVRIVLTCYTLLHFSS